MARFSPCPREEQVTWAKTEALASDLGLDFLYHWVISRRLLAVSPCKTLMQNRKSTLSGMAQLSGYIAPPVECGSLARHPSIGNNVHNQIWQPWPWVSYTIYLDFGFLEDKL